jgi:hypothetical protein
MIIFFGTRSVVSDDNSLGQGSPRQCMQCGQVSIFKPRQARNFIHIFWIPIIPLGKAQPIIECSNCRARFPNHNPMYS